MLMLISPFLCSDFTPPVAKRADTCTLGERALAVDKQMLSKDNATLFLTKEEPKKRHFEKS
jgi:hypothetical protein